MNVTDEMVDAALQTYKSLKTRDMVRDLLRASAKEDSWIVEAEDSLPAYKEQVLIKVSYKSEILLGSYQNIDGWIGNMGNIYNITHWQPLPFNFDEYLMKLAIKAAIQTATEVEQEPIAYLGLEDACDPAELAFDKGDLPHSFVTPLYAHPQPKD
jgi:hypothetical protein